MKRVCLLLILSFVLNVQVLDKASEPEPEIRADYIEITSDGGDTIGKLPHVRRHVILNRDGKYEDLY